MNREDEDQMDMVDVAAQIIGCLSAIFAMIFFIAGSFALGYRIFKWMISV